jgi:hypothetical protein
MCDIPFEHASVSRLHLVLQYKDNGEATLFDPGSTHGCRVNKKPLAKAAYVTLHVGDVVEVAHSSRLLVFCGPEELRPQGQAQSSRDASQSDKMQSIQAKREAAIAAYHAAQQKKAALDKREEAQEEADWGFESDAEEDDEAVCDGIEILTAALRFRESGQLKEKYFPQVEKLERKKHRIDNIKTENKRIRAKEEKGQELSNTQREQLMRNEKAIEELAQQIDEGAELLYSTVLRYLMVDEAAGSDGADGEGGMTADEKEKMRLGIGAWGKNKQRQQRPSGRDSDDEDSFFNRAGAAKPKPAAKGVISYESACSDAIAARQRVQDLEHELQKLDAHDKEMGVVQASDSVDDFLVQMKLDEAVRQRKQLMSQAQRARTECERLEKLKIKLQPMTISDDQLNGVSAAAPAPTFPSPTQASHTAVAPPLDAAEPPPSTALLSGIKPFKKKMVAPSLSISALLKGNAAVKASFKEDAERRVQREQEEAATAAAAAAADLAAPKTAEISAQVEPVALEAGRQQLPNGEIVMTETVCCRHVFHQRARVCPPFLFAELAILTSLIRNVFIFHAGSEKRLGGRGQRGTADGAKTRCHRYSGSGLIDRGRCSQAAAADQAHRVHLFLLLFLPI